MQRRDIISGAFPRHCTFCLFSQGVGSGQWSECPSSAVRDSSRVLRAAFSWVRPDRARRIKVRHLFFAGADLRLARRYRPSCTRSCGGRTLAAPPVGVAFFVQLSSSPRGAAVRSSCSPSLRASCRAILRDPSRPANAPYLNLRRIIVLTRSEVDVTKVFTATVAHYGRHRASRCRNAGEQHGLPGVHLEPTSMVGDWVTIDDHGAMRVASWKVRWLAYTCLTRTANFSCCSQRRGNSRA